MTQGMLPAARLVLPSPPFRTFPRTLWPTGPTEIGLPPLLVATALRPTLPSAMVNLTVPSLTAGSRTLMRNCCLFSTKCFISSKANVLALSTRSRFCPLPATLLLKQKGHRMVASSCVRMCTLFHAGKSNGFVFSSGRVDEVSDRQTHIYPSRLVFNPARTSCPLTLLHVNEKAFGCLSGRGTRNPPLSKATSSAVIPASCPKGEYCRMTDPPGPSQPCLQDRFPAGSPCPQVLGPCFLHPSPSLTPLPLQSRSDLRHGLRGEDQARRLHQKSHTSPEN